MRIEKWIIITRIRMPLLDPFICDGKFKRGFLNKCLEKKL